MDGKTNKLCISLPDEALAQLDYLIEAWRMPPTVKRSQVIQQAIWHAYTDAMRDDVAMNGSIDDYII